MPAGRVPARLFRGSDMPDEVQFENLRKGFLGLGSANIVAGGVMPVGTTALAGTEVSTGGGNIAWWPTSLSFASSTAVQTTQLTHSLGRAPVGFLNILPNAANATMAAASTNQWNATAVSFAVVSFSTAATVDYRIILL